MFFTDVMIHINEQVVFALSISRPTPKSFENYMSPGRETKNTVLSTVCIHLVDVNALNSATENSFFIESIQSDRVSYSALDIFV